MGFFEGREKPRSRSEKKLLRSLGAAFMGIIRVAD
jgi:hypothetical protein